MWRITITLSAVLLWFAAAAAIPAQGAALPTTSITVDGNGGSRVYDGVGAIFGGGGNARYLMDVLQVLDAAEMNVELCDELSPGVLKPAGDPGVGARYTA